jgi:GntR family transcriptional regulator
MDAPQIQLSQASGLPFYRQLVDQVSQLIHAGALEPGERLPSVRELAQQLLVSLITVRRAYADLESAGLIVRRQGQGTFVSDEVAPAARAQVRQDALEKVRQSAQEALRAGVSPDELSALLEEFAQEDPTP